MNPRIGRAVRLALCALWLVSFAWAGCTAGGEPGYEDRLETGAASSDTNDVVVGTDDHRVVQANCIDHDGDQFGIDCPNGPDCDDNDPNVTDQCYRCDQPATGCPCGTTDRRELCNVTTDNNLTAPDGTCHMGERVCVEGAWTHCLPFQTTSRTIIAPTSCDQVCNPMCQQTTVCPTEMADLTAGTGINVTLGNSAGSPLCTPVIMGGFQLPDVTGTGAGTPGGTSGGALSGCAVTAPCGGTCCAANETCTTITNSGIGGGCGGTGSGVSVTRDVCSLVCAGGTTHCGTAPTDQCCPVGQICHDGACDLPNPNGCATNADCPSGQNCLAIGICSSPPTGTAAHCNCARLPNSACLTAARSAGFQEVDGLFVTNSGLDARQLHFARYVRGMERSANSAGPCTALNDCPYGRINRAVAPDPYTCPTCTPVDAAAFQGFSAARSFTIASDFGNALDWRYLDFVRYAADGTVDTLGLNENPWTGLIFDLGSLSNQVAIFGVRRAGDDCCIQGMEYQVWMTNNPGATTIAPAGSPDPNQWNVADWTRMYAEGWTRNPNSLGVPTDTTDLNDVTAGAAIADSFTSVWSVSNACNGYRYVSIQAGNRGSPSASCALTGTRTRIDAVAGLDSTGETPAIGHVLPYNVSAGPDALSARVRVRSADIYFLMESNARMTVELATLQTSLLGSALGVGCSTAVGGIIGSARCAIPDSWFGFGRVNDFPVAPYGGIGDTYYTHLQDLTPDQSTIQSAVSALIPGLGGDTAESEVPALWSIARGTGFGTFLPDRTTCPAGRIGYPCFRPDALPIIVLFTDSMFHNGPGDTYLYNEGDLMLGMTFPAAAHPTTNEDAASAFAIPSDAMPFLAVGNTTFMADNNTTPCCFSDAPDATYALNVTTTRTVVFDTFGSGYDTTISVYRSDGTLIGCNDDYYPDFSSRLTVTLTPGQYYIWIDGYGTNRGAYTLRYTPQSTLPRFPDAIAALNSIGAKVIVINSCNGNPACTPDSANHGTALASQTGSFRNTTSGASEYNTTPLGVATTAATAISELVSATSMDVTAIALDNPATAGVDERCFVTNPAGTPAGTLRLSSTTLGEPAPYVPGQCASTVSTAGGVGYSALGCAANSSVGFRADFSNECVRPTNVDQTFTFDIVYYGNGTIELGRIPVTIVVPRASYPASGSYSYPVDGSTRCAPGEQVSWTHVLTDSILPAGTSIGVEVRTADTASDLSGGTWAALGTITSTPSTLPNGSTATITSVLRLMGIPGNDNFLEVRFTLHGDSSMTATPVLSGFQVQFDCIPNT